MTFSISYYDTTQSVVALKSDPIVTRHSPAELKTYLYGDQIGTTGLAYIYSRIHPTRAPRGLQHPGRSRGRVADKAS